MNIANKKENENMRAYQKERMQFWNEFAHALEGRYNKIYHRRISKIYQLLVPPKSRVLELGCAQGDLLASLKPEVGVGVDFSPEMIKGGKKRYPFLRFIEGDTHNLELDEKFDFIILSDFVNDVWDVQAVFSRMAQLCEPHTRVIINSYSRLWSLPRAFAEWVGITKRLKPQNWLTVEDLKNLLYLSGFEVIRSWQELLWPIPPKFLANFLNRVVVKIWPFNLAALVNFIIVRPVPQSVPQEKVPRVSVIIPARNESGNIEQIFMRTPDMGRGTELVFVEGHSRDGTFSAIEKAIAAHPERRCQLFRQTGEGKGDAVRLGFEKASGDLLMILDADLTVAPEILPRFLGAYMSGKGEFINGVRLVYPMEGQAMQFCNLVANKAFSMLFSWLLGQSVKDTLCGTKVITRKHYQIIAANRAYFGDFDPFGDFDLLFGAAKLNLKIVDIPIRYNSRVYGSTNIHRWKHGGILLKMVLFAMRRIKFI